MPPSNHALLGASSSKRWLNCPPSARLGEGLPDTPSDYAAAGTLAHAIAELKVRKYIEPMSTRSYNSQMKKLKADPHYDKGMDAATDSYLEHIKALAMSYGAVQPFIALETQVDFSDFVPEGFGTADCIVVAPPRMCVVDYKNGAGVLVEAEDNSQMMLYALGALKTYYPIYGDSIREIHLSIVQPNAGGIREWDTTVEALREWGETVVKPAAALAWEGKGNFAAGDWCRFCRARAQCSARAKQMLELGGAPGAGQPIDGALYTDEQLGDILTRGRALAAWIKDLETYALSAALSGRQIGGYKVVEGRGSRDWAGGADAAFAQLQSRGVAEAMLYEREPVSVAALEKSMGKKTFADTAGDLVVKRPGKPALVPENDPREPYTPAEAAFEAVTPDG